MGYSFTWGEYKPGTSDPRNCRMDALFIILQVIVFFSFIKVGNEHAPHTTSFDEAKQRIDSKYSEIETHLLEEFVKSERSNDCQRMKDLALILSQFKVCYDITWFPLIRKNMREF